jgi:hypothetical protein
LKNDARNYYYGVVLGIELGLVHARQALYHSTQEIMRIFLIFHHTYVKIAALG